MSINKYITFFIYDIVLIFTVGGKDPGINLIPIIVGAIAGLLLLLLLAALLAAFLRRKKPQEKEDGLPPDSVDGNGMAESDQMYANLPSDSIVGPAGGYSNGNPPQVQPQTDAQLWNNPGIENDYAPAANGAAPNTTGRKGFSVLPAGPDSEGVFAGGQAPMRGPTWPAGSRGGAPVWGKALEF